MKRAYVICGAMVGTISFIGAGGYFIHALLNTGEPKAIGWETRKECVMLAPVRTKPLETQAIPWLTVGDHELLFDCAGVQYTYLHHIDGSDGGGISLDPVVDGKRK